MHLRAGPREVTRCAAACEFFLSLYLCSTVRAIRTHSSVAKSKYAAPQRRLADLHKLNFLVRRLGAYFIAEPNIFHLNMYSMLLN
jgi:hypothetical protein